MVLTLLSKSVWVDVLHRAHALVFLDNPTLVSVPLAFGGIWIFSMLDLQQHGRMIGRATCSRWHHSVEAQWSKVKLFNERLDDPDRIILGNEVIEAFWKQSHLLAIFTFYESLHPVTQAERVNPVQAINAFSHRLDPFRYLRIAALEWLVSRSNGRPIGRGSLPGCRPLRSVSRAQPSRCPASWPDRPRLRGLHAAHKYRTVTI
ncbi:hypothetical protein P3T23_007078 [Paraburkholderia sp. GAS448]